MGGLLLSCIAAFSSPLLSSPTAVKESIDANHDTKAYVIDAHYPFTDPTIDAQAANVDAIAADIDAQVNQNSPALHNDSHLPTFLDESYFMPENLAAALRRNADSARNETLSEEQILQFKQRMEQVEQLMKKDPRVSMTVVS